MSGGEEVVVQQEGRFWWTIASLLICDESFSGWKPHPGSEEEQWVFALRKLWLEKPMRFVHLMYFLESELGNGPDGGELVGVPDDAPDKILRYRDLVFSYIGKKTPAELAKEQREQRCAA